VPSGSGIKKKDAATTDDTSSVIDAVFSFFKDVPMDGYPERDMAASIIKSWKIDNCERVRPDGWPEQEATPAKSQPWREIWRGPQVPKDGKLIIAYPKGYEWGKIIYMALPLLVHTMR
jgi:hypothetical protein